MEEISLGRHPCGDNCCCLNDEKKIIFFGKFLFNKSGPLSLIIIILIVFLFHIIQI